MFVRFPFDISKWHLCCDLIWFRIECRLCVDHWTIVIVVVVHIDAFGRFSLRNTPIEECFSQPDSNRYQLPDDFSQISLNLLQPTARRVERCWVIRFSRWDIFCIIQPATQRHKREEKRLQRYVGNFLRCFLLLFLGWRWGRPALKRVRCRHRPLTLNLSAAIFFSFSWKIDFEQEGKRWEWSI